jgi:hypothetical protein
LQAVPERREEDRDDPRGEQRDKEVFARLQEHPETSHDQHVETYDANGKHTVDEGAVDDEVHVEEVVAQHGDADRDGDEKHGEIADERIPD